MGDNNDFCLLLGDFKDDDIALSFCNDTEVRSTCLDACQLLACDELESDDLSNLDLFYLYTVRILTFFLLAGFAATVNTKIFFENFKDNGVYLGLFCQFFIMPLLGFCSVLLFSSKLDLFIAILIILVTSCPGGAYSNWFCSMFNADLSLSVAMTTTSTILALFMLPFNTFIYLLLFQTITQDGGSENGNDANSVVSEIPFVDLFVTLSTVLAGVLTGLTFGHFASHSVQHKANMVGNISGILLQVLAVFASSTSCSPPWEQSIYVYFATVIPLISGVAITIALSSKFSLPKPQRVAVVIEAGYQNIGIGAAIALSLGSRGRAAVVVAIIYGLFQAILFISFCILSVYYYKWTLTPPNTSIWNVLFVDYQDYIAVHKYYKSWREKHPGIMKNFTEEEMKKMSLNLGYIVEDDRNIIEEVDLNDNSNNNNTLAKN